MPEVVEDESLYATEVFTNEDKGYRYGGSGEPQECFTTNIKRLFRQLQEENGRCMSKVYVEVEDKIQAIGWYFEKRVEYEDTHDKYLRGTWVTLYDRKGDRFVYHRLN